MEQSKEWKKKWEVGGKAAIIQPQQHIDRAAGACSEQALGSWGMKPILGGRGKWCKIQLFSCREGNEGRRTVQIPSPNRKGAGLISWRLWGCVLMAGMVEVHFWGYRQRWWQCSFLYLCPWHLGRHGEASGRAVCAIQEDFLPKRAAVRPCSGTG